MSPRLLIVDDSSLIRRAIQRALGETRFSEIRSAGNGAEALRVFKTYPAEIITMDITMPEIDGISCVETMIQLRPSSRILVVSALADQATAIEAMTRGAEGFLLKPFTPEELCEAIDDLLQD
ncbi:MAG: response regulator [Verrucomicrobia bacterium]|jgi:two-component system chemotaxis response regulator CheY|nr:response regulator [Verrucomicrobiota bacterium]